MKSRLCHTNNFHLKFNLKFMGVMAGAFSMVLYPAMSKAENPAVQTTQEPEKLSPTLSESVKTGEITIPQEEISPEFSTIPVRTGKMPIPQEEAEVNDLTEAFKASTEIKVFQPSADIKLPRGLQKLAEEAAKSPEAVSLGLHKQSPSSWANSFEACGGRLSSYSDTRTGYCDEMLPHLQAQTPPSENLPQQPEKTEVAPVIPVSDSSVKILSPTPDSVIDLPAVTVTLQFPKGKEVELSVNGELVDRSLIGRREEGADLLTQTWYGVSLKEGENIISAKVVGSNESTNVKVEVRGAPQRLSLETVEARIPADGRSTATVRGELLDKNGNRSNQDAVVTLFSTAGEFVGEDYKPDEPGFQVFAKGGAFTAALKSSLDAQNVRIRARSGELETFAQLQFQTALRPSIVTGVVDLRLGARGTDFFGKLRDFLPPDKDNSTQFDAKAALFATGAIGDWLFTGAVNSDRALNEDCNCDTRLFRTFQFSEQSYPVYGDSSKIDVLTPSTDSFYARLERSSRIPGASPDYFMWGDYNTEEFSRQSQQFTAMTRQLHGFKANYNFGNLQATGFYGNNVQGFQRDTIAPDGTSGYYFLSRRLMVPGSENVFLELEELNRPGTVLQRQSLNRGPDYEINYDQGTLLFRQPVLRTDVDDKGQVLVRRIIVTYQHESQSTDSNIYAGRLQYNLSRDLNQESWLGATYIQENQGVREFELYGADAMISLGSQGKFLAEYARSSNTSDVLGLVSGDAWRVEAESKITNGLQARAYYRFADTGFANNSTISFVPGQARYGAQLTGQLSPTTNLRVQYDHENNFGIAPRPLDTFEELFAPRTQAVPGTKVDNSLSTISAGIQQRFGKASVDVDLLHRSREDRLTDVSTNSNQLRSRLTFPLTDKLTFLAQNELTLSSDVDTVYPDRSILGLNWAAIPGINVSLTQQFYTRGQFEGNSITNLSVNGEHKLGKDTTLTGRYSILGGANELTTQGAIGLNQDWAISPGLRLNLAYEHIFGDLFGRNGAGVQFAQPFAAGQSGASVGFGSGDSYGIGLEYTENPDFKASARYEHRTSSGGSNTVISAGATGKISPALTALVRYQQASSANQGLIGLGDIASLKAGLAYRDPNNDKFNALLRYEYRKNPAVIPDTLLLGSGTGSEDHTFALEAIYAPNWQWEFYGKYALRNSTSYLAQDLVGTSSTNLAQVRATYRLGYSVDLLGEARVISQRDYTETGFVVEAGYYLSPNLRLAAGYVFGKVDDRDFSGTRSAGGAYLGLTVKLDELFDGFGRQKPVPKPQQQSDLKTLLRKALNQRGEAVKLLKI
jgi:hypothetical protein